MNGSKPINRLSLNLDKSRFMQFATKNSPQTDLDINPLNAELNPICFCWHY